MGYYFVLFSFSISRVIYYSIAVINTYYYHISYIKLIDYFVGVVLGEFLGV